MKVIVAAISGATILAVLTIGCGSKVGGPGSETRSAGEIAFRSSCRTCHSLPRPSKYTDNEWPALVTRYGGRARLNDSTIALITAYLTSHN